ncbi:MAG: HNH endonuclease, partial [Myxococcales bacterium]
DVQLLAALSTLVQRENESLSDLLAHLADLDQRELCVAMGYSSLFAYCTEALGFCKSSAGRRIAAARVCREFPEAFARVAKGELQLSVLCALRPHLNAENASELFAACSRKSVEQVEELLAARFPKPEVRDLVRRLPARVQRTPDIGSEMRAAPASAAPTKAPPATGVGTVKPLSLERFSVNFTADGEFRELLDEVRALISHSEPKGDLLTVMKRGLEVLRDQLLTQRFGVGRKPRRIRLKASSDSQTVARPRHESVKQTRHVPAAVARAVYERDQGQCTFWADDGRRCSERRLLQLDHVIPQAEGGEATPTNLRLRCRAHNLHTARQHFGASYIQSAMRRARDAARRTASTRTVSTHAEL